MEESWVSRPTTIYMRMNPVPVQLDNLLLGMNNRYDSLVIVAGTPRRGSLFKLELPMINYCPNLLITPPNPSSWS